VTELIGGGCAHRRSATKPLKCKLKADRLTNQPTNQPANQTANQAANRIQIAKRLIATLSYLL